MRLLKVPQGSELLTGFPASGSYVKLCDICSNVSHFLCIATLIVTQKPQQRFLAWLIPMKAVHPRRKPEIPGPGLVTPTATVVRTVRALGAGGGAS